MPVPEGIAGFVEAASANTARTCSSGSEATSVRPSAGTRRLRPAPASTTGTPTRSKTEAKSPEASSTRTPTGVVDPCVSDAIREAARST